MRRPVASDERDGERGERAAPGARADRTGLAWALCGALCIGLFSVPWKAANDGGDPAVSALVLLATAAVLSTAVSLAQHRAWPRLRRFDWILAALLAALSLVGNQVSAIAVQTISPSVLTVVQRFEAVWVALVAWPLLGERVDGRFWLGLVVALLGLLVLQDPFGELDPRAVGMRWAFLSACLFGSMVIVTRRFAHLVDLVAVNGVRLWLAVALWFVVNGVPETLTSAPRTQVLNAAAAGIVGPFAGRLCMMLSSRTLEARLTTLVTLAAPPVTLAVAFVVLGDGATARELAGGALMMVGIAIPLIRRPRPAKPAA
jgi:drug/metabolite transporter (DMT)-like permease